MRFILTEIIWKLCTIYVVLASEQIQLSFDHRRAFRASQVHISSYTLSSLKALVLVQAFLSASVVTKKYEQQKKRDH